MIKFNTDSQKSLETLLWVLNSGEEYTAPQIVRNLRNIVHTSNNTYYITKGFYSGDPLVIQSERRKTVLNDNLNIMRSFEKHFPNIFTIEQSRFRKDTYKVHIKDSPAIPSKYKFATFVTESGKTLNELGITKEQFDSLNDAEKLKLKKCN